MKMYCQNLCRTYTNKMWLCCGFKARPHLEYFDSEAPQEKRMPENDLAVPHLHIFLSTVSLAKQQTGMVKAQPATSSPLPQSAASPHRRVLHPSPLHTFLLPIHVFCVSSLCFS